MKEYLFKISLYSKNPCGKLREIIEKNDSFSKFQRCYANSLGTDIAVYHKKINEVGIKALVFNINFNIHQDIRSAYLKDSNAVIYVPGTLTEEEIYEFKERGVILRSITPKERKDIDNSLEKILNETIEKVYENSKK